MKVSRPFIGVVGPVLLLLGTTAVPAQAAAMPYLGGKLCKFLGGTWESGADRTCTLDGQMVTTSFVVKANTTLALSGNTLIYTGEEITNNGSIVNFGTIANGGTITNRGTITNADRGMILNPAGTIDNFGRMINGGDITNYPGSTINNYSGGTITNNGTITNDSGGIITNSVGGIITNNVGAYINNFFTVTNNGTISNCGFWTGYNSFPNAYLVC